MTVGNREEKYASIGYFWTPNAIMTTNAAIDTINQINERSGLRDKLGLLHTCLAVRERKRKASALNVCLGETDVTDE